MPHPHPPPSRKRSHQSPCTPVGPSQYGGPEQLIRGMMMYYYICWLYIVLRTFVWFILQWPRYLFQRDKVVQKSENPLGWERLKYHIFKNLLALQHTAKLGNKAPNCKVVTLRGESCCLLDFMKPSRPLVLNFGSCT